MKITVSKNGPYIVTGNVPLYLKYIVIEKRLAVLKTIKKLDTEEEYNLCRCGKTRNAPFCDGAHVKMKFNGKETAGMSSYMERAELLTGEDLDLLDDQRCAFARFCHRKHGDVWELTEQSGNTEYKQEAILGAQLCPSGRLMAMLKSGELLEEGDLKPCISIIQDYPRRVSAGIFVTGKIPIQSEKGEIYEVRNREALCRCGKSQLKPFCDTKHIHSYFKDNMKEE